MGPSIAPELWHCILRGGTSRSRSLAFTTQLASPVGGGHVLVQEHSGAVASYGANEYGVLGHGSDSASKGMLPARIPDVQFEQVRVLTLPTLLHLLLSSKSP